MNSERLYKQTLSLHRFKPESVTAVTESVKLAGASIHTENLSASDNCSKRTKSVFDKGVPLVFQITLQFQLHAEH